MPAVSVLMPCYNAARTLEEALHSLQQQSFPDFEVVAVDDGSNDNTHAILSEWSRQDRRFRVISMPHAGIIGALNAGLAACQAPLIARMDADDRSCTDRLSRQVDFLDCYPEISVVGSLVRGFPPGQVREGFKSYIEWLNSLTTDSEIRRDIFVESPLVHPSVLFRRECVEQVGGYQEKGWPEDYDLWLRLYLEGARFAKVPEVLLEWREDPLRLTRRDSRYSMENFVRAKAYYLARGPLVGRDAVFIWGAGMMGRYLSRHLLGQKIPLVAFADIDPRKIGSTRQGFPILSPEELLATWGRYANPVVLAAVGAHNARPILRARFRAMGLQEEKDWWCAA